MLMTFNLIMTVIIVSVQQSHAYRYTMFPNTDFTDLCNDLECKGGVRHTICKKLKPSSQCSDFKLIEMTTRVINTMVLGHNGIRNKIASDFYIGNMNALHWSRELEKLSRHFLMSCNPTRDVCDFLDGHVIGWHTQVEGDRLKLETDIASNTTACSRSKTVAPLKAINKNTTIGQNFYFSKAPPSARWAGRAIRSWYFELGYRIKRWDQFKEARDKNQNFTEFTQMIWPKTEFVGCGAARMFDGYLATCYYHPAVTEGWDDFALGEPCTRCVEDRPTCSRDFTQLCGLDITYDSSRSQFECSAKTIFLCLLLVMRVFG